MSSQEEPVRVEALEAALRDQLLRTEALEAELARAQAQVLEAQTEVRRFRQDIWSLEEVQQALEAVSRSGSEFVIHMDHRIRTSLNGLLGMVELLLNGDLSPEQLEFAQAASNSGGELLALMNDILDYCRMDAGQVEISPESFEASDFLAELVANTSQRAASRGLEVVQVVGDGVPRFLRADKVHLLRAASHLLENSLRFTERGGIQVGFELDPLAAGPELVFFVADTGVGIAREDLARVCEAFERGDGACEAGLGLGLTLVRRLVELMGGRFALTSEVGVGSRATLSFDLSDITMSEQLLTNGHAPQVPTNARVLVVEDNEVNQRVAVGFLRMIGCETDVAENGLQAIERLADSPFDLILMDCMMPELDGYGTTRRIRDGQAGEDLRAIPIVALTADDSVGARQNCLRAGMDDYMTKPVRLDKLRDALRCWLPPALRPAQG